MNEKMKIEADSGYYFGLGAFETISVKKGKPLLLKEHLERLQGALDFLGITKEISQEYVYEKLQSDRDYERIENLVLKIAVSDNNIVCTTRTHDYTKERYEKGFDLTYTGFCRNETSPFVGFKVLNHAENIYAMRQAKKQGKDEALFLNTKGEISEGSCSNIFFVSDGKLLTPEKECGLLPGVMRNLLIREENVEETKITPEDLKDFQECFVTNSLMGIMKVNSIGKKQFTKSNFIENLQKKYGEYY